MKILLWDHNENKSNGPLTASQNFKRDGEEDENYRSLLKLYLAQPYYARKCVVMNITSPNYQPILATLHQLHYHIHRIYACFFACIFPNHSKPLLDFETYSTLTAIHHLCWTVCFINTETKCLKHLNLTHSQFQLCLKSASLLNRRLPVW